MKSKIRDTVLEKACELFDAEEYNKAKGYFINALPKNQHISDLIYLYLSKIEKKNMCIQEAYDISIKACMALGNNGLHVTNSLLRKIFMNHAEISWLLGKHWEAIAYFYKAYKVAEDKDYKMITLSASLMPLAASDAMPRELLDVMKEINIIINEGVKPEVIDNFKHNFEGKIHVAYISPDFRYHVMYCFYYNLLKKYNREEFEVTCISLTTKKDENTEKLRTLPNNFVDFSNLKLEDLVLKLRELKIDILVDLAGHSLDTGLPVFAYRVAPVQISGLGWMETTGLDSVDYLLTDKYLDPLGQSYITERPMFLTSQFCYNCHVETEPSKGAPCMENGYITFGTFNRFNKFTQDILEIWRKIMYLVPKSKLLLKDTMFVNLSNMRLARNYFLQAGLDNNRIILEPPSSIMDYMESYRKIDIALDTYPYTGGGTTFDALYMGVPVVSMYGERRSSRFGLSILSNAGVGELAVKTEKEYIERAVALANDWETLDLLHKNLRTIMQNSPAMDGEGYVREIELQYKTALADALK